jgi:LacI family transcriptional regulator
MMVNGKRNKPVDDGPSPRKGGERRRAITQTEIARALGISRATVSFVLNGRGDDFGIREETSRRVLEMAGKLQYIPNAMARSLKSKHTGTIAILVADFQLNWTHRVQVGIERTLSVGPESRFTPLFAPRGWSAERERREIDWFLEHRADAIIVCVPIPSNRSYYRRVMELGVPLMFIGDTLDDMPDANYVIWNSSEAVKVGMHHLYDIGRRRIAFFGIGEDTVMTRARYRAYKESIQELGLILDPKRIFMETVSRSEKILSKGWREAFRRLLLEGEDRPDAVFALNDALALGLLDFLQSTPGVRVPEDIAIMAMGGLPIQGAGGERITTMDEPLEILGERAAQCTLELLKSPAQQPHQVVITHDHLLIRDTTFARSRAD